MNIFNKKIFGDTFLVSASLFSRVAANVVFFYVLAFLVPASDFGELLLFFTVSALLACFVEYGFSTLIIAKSNKDRSEVLKIYREVRSARLYLTVFALLVYVVIVLVWPVPEEGGWSIGFLSKISIFLAGVLLVNAQAAEALLRAVGQVKNELKSAVMGNLAFLFFSLGSVIYFKDISCVPLAMVLGRGMHFLGSELRVREISSQIVMRETARSSTKEWLFKNRYFAFQAVAATAYLQIDSVIIGIFLGPESVANYQLLFRVVLGVGILADASSSIKLKKIVSKTEYDRERVGVLKWEWLFAFTVAVLASVIMLILVALLKYGFIFRAGSLEGGYDFDFIEVSTLAASFVLLVFVRFWIAHLGVVLTAHGKQRIRSNGALGALMVIIALCCIAVPIMGVTGAALASLFGNLCIVYFYLRSLK